ncbi:hypothetical protein E3N88_01609 [Mikania micrantha]|uniref:Uncharacterized protein n=1 Tax=Mikania micrantha TaxID=192012 RepID=A0A5N6Q219_9ASTR|nr:hypothetical protein E3N88_01609 [Mikania micrantha]
MEDHVVPKTFKTLVKKCDRKFAKVRDIPVHGFVPSHYFSKVFKAYTKLWKFQQQNRAKLIDSGLQRWEIGEIASRIGQLYYLQYTRTSEARFLIESYIFYEAILNRSYFDGSHCQVVKDRGLRFKELRFYARFLQVSLILNRWEIVQLLLDRFKALVDDSNASFGVIFFIFGFVSTFSPALRIITILILNMQEIVTVDLQVHSSFWRC